MSYIFHALTHFRRLFPFSYASDMVDIMAACIQLSAKHINQTLVLVVQLYTISYSQCLVI